MVCHNNLFYKITGQSFLYFYSKDRFSALLAPNDRKKKCFEQERRGGEGGEGEEARQKQSCTVKFLFCYSPQNQTQERYPARGPGLSHRPQCKTSD